MGDSDTATAAEDFATTQGTLTLAAGASTARFSVPILDDLEAEGPERFLVRLSGASLGAPSEAEVLIEDDELEQTFAFEVDRVAVPEADGSVAITVLRTGNRTGDASVAYAVAGGTAASKRHAHRASADDQRCGECNGAIENLVRE